MRVVVHEPTATLPACQNHSSSGLEDLHNCPGHPAGGLNLDLGRPSAFKAVQESSKASGPGSQRPWQGLGDLVESFPLLLESQ